MLDVVINLTAMAVLCSFDLLMPSRRRNSSEVAEPLPVCHKLNKSECRLENTITCGSTQGYADALDGSRIHATSNSSPSPVENRHVVISLNIVPTASEAVIPYGSLDNKLSHNSNTQEAAWSLSLESYFSSGHRSSLRTQP